MQIYVAGSISHLKMKDAKNTFDNIKYEIEQHTEHKAYCSLRHIHNIDNDTIIRPHSHNEDYLSTDVSIFNRCRNDIRRADIVLFYLRDVKKVSIGSIYEMSLAYTLSKDIIVVMEDGNIHDHAFVKQSASYITDNILDVIEYLRNI